MDRAESPRSPALMSPGTLEEQLRSERQKVAILTEENKRLKVQAVQALASAEVEEEGVINKLIRRLETLKKEKEDLAMAIDREEEFLTNTLQRRMTEVQREKVEIENRLEAEQENISIRLQKQIAQITREKQSMERKVEEERKSMQHALDVANEDCAMLRKKLEDEDVVVHRSATLEQKLNSARKDKVNIEAACEAEQEFLVNRLQQQMESVVTQKSALSARMDALPELLQEAIDTTFEKHEADASGPTAALMRKLHDALNRAMHNCLDSSALESEKPSRARGHSHGIKSPHSNIHSIAEDGATDRSPTSPAKFLRGPLLNSRSVDAPIAPDDVSRLQKEVRVLRNENFVLAQKLQVEREKTAAMSSETSRLATELEVDSERQFNVRNRGASFSASISMDGGDSSAHPRDRAPSEDAAALSARLEAAGITAGGQVGMVRRYSTSSSCLSLEGLGKPQHTVGGLDPGRGSVASTAEGSLSVAFPAPRTPLGVSGSRRISPMPSPVARGNTPRLSAAESYASMVVGSMSGSSTAAKLSQAFQPDEGELAAPAQQKRPSVSRGSQLSKLPPASRNSPTPAALASAHPSGHSRNRSSFDSAAMSDDAVSLAARSCTDDHDTRAHFRKTLADVDDTDGDITAVTDSDVEGSQTLSVARFHR